PPATLFPYTTLFRSGVVGLAGQQQALNRLIAGKGLCRDRPGAGDAGFYQRQAAVGPIGGQPLFIAKDQLNGHAGAGEAGGPETAEAAGTEDVPAHAGWNSRSGRRMEATRPLAPASARRFSACSNTVAGDSGRARASSPTTLIAAFSATKPSLVLKAFRFSPSCNRLKLLG